MSESGDTVRSRRATAVGKVKSDKTDKTIKVSIERQMEHPFYGKRLTRTTTYTAHDEKNEAREGDIVEIAETRKLSKTKAWRLVRILKQAERVDTGAAT
jgi:small subunit ribosomal protein S17